MCEVNRLEMKIAQESFAKSRCKANTGFQENLNKSSTWSLKATSSVSSSSSFPSSHPSLAVQWGQSLRESDRRLSPEISDVKVNHCANVSFQCLWVRSKAGNSTSTFTRTISRHNRSQIFVWLLLRTGNRSNLERPPEQSSWHWLQEGQTGEPRAVPLRS